MKKLIIVCAVLLVSWLPSQAQIDLEHLDLRDLIGKVMHVEKGFAPQFSLGNTPIKKMERVAEILGLKKNEDVNRLFRTFRTGRIIYKVAAYTGGAVVAYSLIRKVSNSLESGNYETALYSGLGAIGSGLIVKFLTKQASYKAVDIFNDIAVKKILDIFSIRPASGVIGVGLYVKL